MEKPTIGTKQVVYRNKYQQIYQVRADFSSFSKEYFVIDTGEKAGMIVVRGDQVLLVRQYRLLIDGLSWEIPGGKVDEGEAPVDAALRECLEETGVRCLDPQPLLFYHAGLDTSNNPTYLFHTEQIAEGREPEQIHAQEVSGAEWVPLARCIEMIYTGEIVDSFSVIGLLAYHNRHGGPSSI
jgi:ADP-ribose pyrophosphatase